MTTKKCSVFYPGHIVDRIRKNLQSSEWGEKIRQESINSVLYWEVFFGT